ncbi:MAG: D-TA family PLP-dependent enzyme [Verrucomicrobiales bacterium]|nr:D-TA family PLP-dependent enzyme [Verrucomicrobiales bacterium]
MPFSNLHLLREVPSPALILVRERIESNLRTMIALAGHPARLRPHLKTHKLAELVRRQIELGITRFKTATVAETEMAAAAGAPDVLLACQPVGPHPARLAQLAEAFPKTTFRALADDPQVVRQLSEVARKLRTPLDVLVDLDVGQHRTGLPAHPPEGALALALLISQSPGLHFGGWHAYDGHLHDPDPTARALACDAAFAPVPELTAALKARHGLDCPRVVAGGTPTFPMHARRPGVECSPGTCVLWDAGYSAKLPDLHFDPAAFLLTRVVSRPTAHRICFDLGHKAVASEMPQPRAVLPEIRDAQPVAHNEEHLVIETADAARWKVGDATLAIPWHVCPTVALHAEAWVIEPDRSLITWQIHARARRLRF